MKNFVRLVFVTAALFLNFSEPCPAAQSVSGVVSGTVANEVFSPIGTNAIDSEIAKSVGVNMILATNGQVLNRPTNYFVAANTTVFILMTNGGVINIYGDGIVSSNWMANGAVANIQCNQYCPNDGQTIFNFRSNWWQSVTCRVDCVEADIDDSLRNEMHQPLILNMGGNTTNQPDIFFVNASRRINYWEWEMKAYNTTLWTNFVAAKVFWKTPYFDATHVCFSNGHVPTCNISDGSTISANIFDVGNNPDGWFFQLWNALPYTNIVLTFDVGTLIDSQGAPVLPVMFYSYLRPGGTLNSGSGLVNGVNLPRTTIDADQVKNNSDYDFQFGTLYNNDPGVVMSSGTAIIGSYYEPVLNSVVGTSQFLINGTFTGTTASTNIAPLVRVANPLVSGGQYTTPNAEGFVVVNLSCTDSAFGWFTNYTTHFAEYVGTVSQQPHAINYQTHILRTAPGDIVGLTNKTGTLTINTSEWRP